MGHRHDRHDDARERANLAGVHAAGVDDDLGLDLTAIGLDDLRRDDGVCECPSRASTC